jgi:hypothetical protein
VGDATGDRLKLVGDIYFGGSLYEEIRTINKIRVKSEGNA